MDALSAPGSGGQRARARRAGGATVIHGTAGAVKKGHFEGDNMRKTIWIAAVAAVAVGSGAFAMANRSQQHPGASVRERFGEMVDASRPTGPAQARFEAKLAAQTARELDVGDADSFGRPVRWMGFASTPGINVRDSCVPRPEETPSLCMESSTGQEYREAEFRDLAQITLPARSTHSLLCHWLTPSVAGILQNSSGIDNGQAELVAMPSITIENEVLNDPTILDPVTGLPYNGKMEVYANTSMISAPLDTGEQTFQLASSTRTCISGYLNRRELVSSWGLTDAQALEFFNKPMTLRLHILVAVRMVLDGQVAMSVRFVGD